MSHGEPNGVVAELSNGVSNGLNGGHIKAVPVVISNEVNDDHAETVSNGVPNGVNGDHLEAASNGVTNGVPNSESNGESNGESNAINGDHVEAISNDVNGQPKDTTPKKTSEEPPIFGRIRPTVKQPIDTLPAYFWGEEFSQGANFDFPPSRGYKEARRLIGEGSVKQVGVLIDNALEYLKATFTQLDQPSPDTAARRVTPIRLSDDLQQWREQQHTLGRVLPKKGYGLAFASDEVISLLGAADWATPLKTNNSIFGSGFANLLMGAYDPDVLYSNYVLDLVFYYEHAYHKVFPDFETALKRSFEDPHALNTHGGRERRGCAEIGQDYVRKKIDLEETHKKKLANKCARMGRTEAFILSMGESSILGIAGESFARGFDAAGVLHDLVFASPGTDVVDVGCDIWNSELFNSFLNTKDMTETGVVTEEAMRQVYDAYAHLGGRMFTERWSEPGARMSSCLYVWHLCNNRHHFLRRAVLGWSKARKLSTPDQREGDWDEIFDEDFHTTGLSRPLKTACNGQDYCDHINELLSDIHASHGPEAVGIAWNLWWHLTVGPVQYARAQTPDPPREEEMMNDARVALCKVYSIGLVNELAWIMAHASQHAWQVNYLFEAAMFGSVLDDGGLKGRLDRAET